MKGEEVEREGASEIVMAPALLHDAAGVTGICECQGHKCTIRLRQHILTLSSASLSGSQFWILDLPTLFEPQYQSSLPTCLELYTAHNTSQASCQIRDRYFFKDRLSDKHVPQLVTSPLYPNPVTHYPR